MDTFRRSGKKKMRNRNKLEFVRELSCCSKGLRLENCVHKATNSRISLDYTGQQPKKV